MDRKFWQRLDAANDARVNALRREAASVRNDAALLAWLSDTDDRTAISTTVPTHPATAPDKVQASLVDALQCALSDWGDDDLGAR